MIIKNAKASLLIKDVIVSDISMHNDLAQFFKFDENNQTIDMDYVILNADEYKEKVFNGEVILTTKIIMKSEKKKIFELKISHKGLFAAPKDAYASLDEFKKALEINGVASLISIARANISAITSVAFCNGNVTIPMINVFQLKKLKEQAQVKVGNTNN